MKVTNSTSLNFDFMNFTSCRAIAIDANYILKSEKDSLYRQLLAWMCSINQKGFEIMDIAAIDIDFHRVLHLEAIQTPPTKILSQMFKNLIVIQTIIYFDFLKTIEQQ